MTWIEPLDGREGHARFVIERMRDWDRREIFATRGDDGDEALLADVMAVTGPSWVAGRDAEPIAVYGCQPLWPGVAALYMFATDIFRQIGKSVTAHAVREVIPGLWAAGAHRLECRSMEGHIDAQHWIERLGARREATMTAYGRGREDFHLYVWEAPHVLR